MPNFLLNPWLTGIAINFALLIPAYLSPKKLLTPEGIIHAWVLGVLLYGCLGWQGYTLMMVYFLLGSAVTRIGMAEKEAAGIAEKRSGARGPENVWGSALVATICAIAFWMLKVWNYRELMQFGQLPAWATLLPPLLLLAYTASMATKLSDTCASEIGKAYGKRTFLITTLKPVPRGTEGAVSLEGTIAGIMASLVIALVGWGLGLVPHQYPIGIAICVLAAFVATNLESVIGATLQTQFSWLTNELVNVINTLIGALVAIGLGVLLFH
ncbi:TIGR00297 family protein [Alkalinema sp. FACHB-956]|uniref:TIGR00297 family protein n=1 Tax=Alkalinema sp. FACHB-956 TaxID=2692768 RepID=UPI0016863AA4|nr:TIGR00297 family protein [Alkalinema sp. FACHB-956]MBD2326309.1 TIGR00297 family protein [Alkalinema sp. FACHB-956]